MELYQLRTFVTVAREGHLTRAAERLFTSQPTVSAHIKALEEEFGLRLFERTPGGMVPTAAGEALWEEAERLLGASKDFAARAAALKGNVGGTLRLGLNNDTCVLRSTDLLVALTKAHPGLRFELVAGTSGVLRQAVLDRELDAAFHEGAIIEPAIEVVELAHLELIIVMPNAWAVELAHPDWRPLATKPWVVGNPGCSFAAALDVVAREHGFQPQKQFAVDNDGTMLLELVASGHAIAVTTREDLRARPGMEERVAVWPHFRRPLPLSLCFLKTRADDSTLRALVNAARTLWTAPEANASSF